MTGIGKLKGTFRPEALEWRYLKRPKLTSKKVESIRWMSYWPKSNQSKAPNGISSVVPAFLSKTTPRFWKLFAELPVEVQDLAIEKYELFKCDPFHPSLGFKAKGRVWTVESAELIAPSPIDPKTACHGSGLARTKITIPFCGVFIANSPHAG